MNQLKKWVPWTVIVFSILMVLILEAIAINSINQNTKSRTEQLNRLSNRIDCFAIYFNQPNRADLVIADIDKCVIKSVNSNIPLNSFPPQTSSPSATTAPSGQQSAGKSQSSVATPGQGGTTTAPSAKPQPSVLQDITDTAGGIIDFVNPFN